MTWAGSESIKSKTGLALSSYIEAPPTFPRRVQFGGLGQLCDGVLGGDDFMESKELRVWPGYDYLGWNRDVLGKPSVDIEFHFEKPRVLRVMQVGSATWQPVYSCIICIFLFFKKK